MYVHLHVCISIMYLLLSDNLSERSAVKKKKNIFRFIKTTYVYLYVNAAFYVNITVFVVVVVVILVVHSLYELRFSSTKRERSRRNDVIG